MGGKDEKKHEDEDESWSARDRLQCVYTFFFGLIIFVSDLKAEWANMFYNMQTKLFQYFYFLATQLGRAAFYFYVGSITLFLLPENTLWQFFFIIIGGVLCFLGL